MTSPQFLTSSLSILPKQEVSGANVVMFSRKEIECFKPVNRCSCIMISRACTSMTQLDGHQPRSSQASDPTGRADIDDCVLGACVIFGTIGSPVLISNQSRL